MSSSLGELRHGDCVSSFSLASLVHSSVPGLDQCICLERNNDVLAKTLFVLPFNTCFETYSSKEMNFFLFILFSFFAIRGRTVCLVTTTMSWLCTMKTQG